MGAAGPWAHLEWQGFSNGKGRKYFEGYWVPLNLYFTNDESEAWSLQGRHLQSVVTRCLCPAHFPRLPHSGLTA